MKLFVVLYTFGHLTGVWGPVPYDKAECIQRAADTTAEFHQKVIDRKGPPIKWHDLAITPDAMKWVCEEHDKAPELSEP